METRREGERQRGRLLAELRATDEPGNQRTPPDSPSSPPPSGLALAGNSLFRLRAVVRSGWARPHPREGKRKKEDGRREGREGGSGEAENTEQKAERPPARVANFQQLYRRRSFAPERLIISSVLDASSSSSSASRYNEDRGEERSGRSLVSRNKRIAILRNRFLSRSRVNPKSGYLPPASVHFERKRASVIALHALAKAEVEASEGRREDR